MLTLNVSGDVHIHLHQEGGGSDPTEVLTKLAALSAQLEQVLTLGGADMAKNQELLDLVTKINDRTNSMKGELEETSRSVHSVRGRFDAVLAELAAHRADGLTPQQVADALDKLTPVVAQLEGVSTRLDEEQKVLDGLGASPENPVPTTPDPTPLPPALPPVEPTQPSEPTPGEGVPPTPPDTPPTPPSEPPTPPTQPTEPAPGESTPPSGGESGTGPSEGEGGPSGRRR